jgi:hypothetical protein
LDELNLDGLAVGVEDKIMKPFKKMAVVGDLRIITSSQYLAEYWMSSILALNDKISREYDRSASLLWRKNLINAGHQHRP